MQLHRLCEAYKQNCVQDIREGLSSPLHPQRLPLFPMSLFNRIVPEPESCQLTLLSIWLGCVASLCRV